MKQKHLLFFILLAGCSVATQNVALRPPVIGTDPSVSAQDLVRVNEFLTSYQAAYNAHDVVGVLEHYAEPTVAHAEHLHHFFDMVRDYRVTTERLGVARSPEGFIVTFRRSDKFVDPSGASQDLSIVQTQLLVDDGACLQILLGHSPKG